MRDVRPPEDARSAGGAEATRVTAQHWTAPGLLAPQGQPRRRRRPLQALEPLEPLQRLHPLLPLRALTLPQMSLPPRVLR